MVREIVIINFCNGVVVFLPNDRRGAEPPVFSARFAQDQHR
jgi:hypothetical protein